MIFLTSLKAIAPNDGQIKTWCGPNVEAITEKLARKYLDENGLGYCQIEGRLIAEVPFKTKGLDGIQYFDNPN